MKIRHVRKQEPGWYSNYAKKIVASLGAFIVLAGSVVAQDELTPSREVSVDYDSGSFFNEGDLPEKVWTKTIMLKNAKWVRLHFKYLVLAHDELGNTSSTLRITSLKDGAVQILNGKTAREWRNTSAYFNGNAVRLELTAYPNGRMNRVAVDQVRAGEVPTPQESICDDVDDRQLSDDPRVGRTDGGCTGWLFNNRKNCMLTAGHCEPFTDVMLFNVPISDPDGSYNFPGPNDQYVADESSKQFVDGGVGDDWCYFGCFPNSNTGLSALDAQGGTSFQLVSPPAVTSGSQIRITGFGTTSAPVSPTFNGAQKTQVGPYSAFQSTTLNYRTDTTGGNSGSPVILESTGAAIGIHTHGGCGSGTGANAGTASSHNNFQDALANPLGICFARVELTFPEGRPDVIAPEGGTTFRVDASDSGVAPQENTGMLHYSTGGAFQSIPMTQTSPNSYLAEFPPIACGLQVSYYVSVEGVDSTSYTNPRTAPEITFAAISADSIQLVFEDDFETNLGWTVTGNATDGQWERGIPAGAADRGDPATDGDGSGSCYVTDNVAGNSDVDGGSTQLTSPTLDASGNGDSLVSLSYYRWYSNNFGASPFEDSMTVELSNDNGASWVLLETVGPTGDEVTGGWYLKKFLINDILPPTNQMRVRFTASDLNEGSVVEAGVDGLKLEVIECSTTETEVPESYQITNGELVGGELADLADSDNSTLRARKMATQITGGVTVEFKATSQTESPTNFEFTLEGSVFARRDIQQTIELFNYNSDSWEALDTRSSSRTGDIVVTVTPTGDLGRFVQPGTSCIEARVRFVSSVQRQLFQARLDQAIWTITN